MVLAFATTAIYFDVDISGGVWTYVFLFVYFVIAQALINLLTAKLHSPLPTRIYSRGIGTFALVIFYSFINGMLILLFAKVTGLINFNSLYQPFIVAASMMLIRQLFD